MPGMPIWLGSNYAFMRQPDHFDATEVTGNTQPQAPPAVAQKAAILLQIPNSNYRSSGT